MNGFEKLIHGGTGGFVQLLEENEAGIREIARESIYSFTKWLYGYEKYDKEDFKGEANVVGKFRERDLCLSFLAKKLLESEIECKATALESLMKTALESPMIEDYPVCGTLDLLRERGRTDDSKFELIVRVDDGFSETEKFLGVLEKVVESELENFKKTAIFLRMIDSAKAAKRNNLALDLTERFFDKDSLRSSSGRNSRIFWLKGGFSRPRRRSGFSVR